MQGVDPLLGVKYVVLFLLVGTVEIAVGAYGFLGRNPLAQLGALAWLGVSFVAYRVGSWIIGAVKPCGCLGAFRQILVWIANHQEQCAVGTLVFLLIGSHSLLALRYLMSSCGASDRVEGSS